MPRVFFILAIMLLIVGIVAIGMALFVFFKFDIRGAIGIINGTAAKKQISQIRQRTSSTRSAGNPIANRQVWNGQVAQVDHVNTYSDTPDIPLDSVPASYATGASAYAAGESAAYADAANAEVPFESYPGEQYTDVLDETTYDDGLTDEQRGFAVIYDQLVVHTTERIAW